MVYDSCSHPGRVEIRFSRTYSHSYKRTTILSASDRWSCTPLFSTTMNLVRLLEQRSIVDQPVEQISRWCCIAPRCNRILSFSSREAGRAKNSRIRNLFHASGVPLTSQTLCREDEEGYRAVPVVVSPFWQIFAHGGRPVAQPLRAREEDTTSHGSPALDFEVLVKVEAWSESVVRRWSGDEGKEAPGKGLK